MYTTLQSSQNNQYLFDALTNEIYQLDNDFDLVEGSSRKELGLPEFSRKIGYNTETPTKLKNSAKTLIIELTEQCNLRCTYCVFDESYSAERSHSSKNISISNAKQAILDFHHRTKKDAYIIFYGGEPLLEFSVIQELTKYAKQLFKKKVQFSFTTNGMALTKNKFDFLVSNNFLITVSLDGYKRNHDKNRITVNGKPSWDKIISNLSDLKKTYPKFYAEKIIINSVLETFDEMKLSNHEFRNNELFKHQEIRFSFTIQNAIIETKAYNKQNEHDYEDLYNLFFDKKISNNKFYEDRLLPLVQKIAFRKLGHEAQTGKKKCVPFVNRTYVRSNGTKQFCERISSFGVVKDNEELLNTAISIQEEFYKNKQNACEKCIAYNFCELCPASFYYDGNFSKEEQSICNNFREEFLLALQLYIDLSENNVTFSEL